MMPKNVSWHYSCCYNGKRPVIYHKEDVGEAQEGSVDWYEEKRWFAKEVAALQAKKEHLFVQYTNASI